MDIVPRGRPDDIDVIAHQLTRRLPVPAQHGVETGIVLRVRFGQALGNCELRATKWRDALANADRRRQQKLVVRAATYDIVKLEIERAVALLIVVADGFK